MQLLYSQNEAQSSSIADICDDEQIHFFVLCLRQKLFSKRLCHSEDWAREHSTKFQKLIESFCVFNAAATATKRENWNSNKDENNNNNHIQNGINF